MIFSDAHGTFIPEKQSKIEYEALFERTLQVLTVAAIDHWNYSDVHR